MRSGTHRAVGGTHARILVRNASGLRHLRWAREVLGTLEGLAAHPEHLSGLQRAAILAEVAHVKSLVLTLSSAVKTYRDFLERTRTHSRGKLRAAELFASGAPGLAIGDPSIGARLVDAARSELSGITEPERRRLHTALARAIDETRAGLVAMEERLGGCFSPEVVSAMYPPLTADATRVHDDGDPDDDAAGSHGEG